jgi:hypothetical protein
MCYKTLSPDAAVVHVENIAQVSTGKHATLQRINIYCEERNENGNSIVILRLQ